MAKHTPAPWRVGEHEKKACLYVDAGDSSMGAVACLWDAGKSRTETEANARLIAAAPDLLDSLKAMVALVSLLTGPTDTIAAPALVAAHAAIDKAVTP